MSPPTMTATHCSKHITSSTRVMNAETKQANSETHCAKRRSPCHRGDSDDDDGADDGRVDGCAGWGFAPALNSFTSRCISPPTAAAAQTFKSAHSLGSAPFRLSPYGTHSLICSLGWARRPEPCAAPALCKRATRRVDPQTGGNEHCGCYYGDNNAIIKEEVMLS